MLVVLVSVLGLPLSLLVEPPGLALAEVLTVLSELAARKSLPVVIAPGLDVSMNDVVVVVTVASAIPAPSVAAVASPVVVTFVEFVADAVRV